MAKDIKGIQKDEHLDVYPDFKKGGCYQWVYCGECMARWECPDVKIVKDD
jgi:hypothetical protein